MLRELCDQEDRFDFQSVSRSRMLPHGTLLDKLYEQEQSEVFAFMDSDCFATGNWFQQLAPHLRDNDAVFAGLPLWSEHWLHTLPSGSRLLADAYDRLDDNSVVGNSHFASYDMRVLSDCIRDTGCSFKMCYWREIPPSIQKELARAGKKLNWYETGKVLNILLGLRGHRCKSVRLPHLWHLGDMSSLVVRRRRLADVLDRFGIMQPLLHLIRWLGLREDPMQGVSEEERERRRQYYLRRNSVSAHFGALLQCLEDGRPHPPIFQHKDEALEAIVNRAEEHIELPSKGV